MIKTFEQFGKDLGMDLEESKFGSTVYMIMSLDEKYYVHEVTGLSLDEKYYVHEVTGNNPGWVTQYYYRPLLVSEMNLTTLQDYSYDKESIEKKFNYFIKVDLDKFIGNTLIDKLEIKGWKIVPFFLGAYRL